MSMSKAKAENRPLPRRFYTEVAIGEGGTGWQIHLDGRPVKTPAKHALSTPSERLAGAIAAEWDDQGEHINPFTMPLTRLAHVAIDRMGDVREPAATEIAKYAGSDLLCYRAGEPELAALQARHWDGYIDWAAAALDAPLNVTEGVSPIEQPEASIKALEARALALDEWRLTGLSSAVPLLGSAVLGFALLEGEATGRAVFEASRLDERYQAERWGEDAEAAETAEAKMRDLLAVEQLFRILDEDGA